MNSFVYDENYTDNFLNQFHTHFKINETNISYSGLVLFCETLYREAPYLEGDSLSQDFRISIPKSQNVQSEKVSK